MTEIVNISGWQVAKYDCAVPDGVMPVPAASGWLPAVVPGAVQYDLVKAGQLENPYASTKAAFDAAWVAKSDWVYRAEFDTPLSVSDTMGGMVSNTTAGMSPKVSDTKGGMVSDTFFLRFKGVDTYSEVWLNGKLLGETANAMRVYELPVAPCLLSATGKNTLLVRVKSHERMIASKIDETEKHLHNGRDVEGTIGKSLIRRYQRSFFAGSSLLNLGTGVLGIGLNRPVELVTHTGAYIKDCFWRTEKLEGMASDGDALLAKGSVSVIASAVGPDVTLRLTILDADGSFIMEEKISLKDGENKVPITIQNPHLWWPAGYGKPYLYTLKVELAQGERTLDEWTQKIGVKTVSLVKELPGGRKAFYFLVNGKKIIIHGENHIPLDYIKCYGTPAEYDRIFRLLENQRVNCVRMWGGGVVEDPVYYEYCDRLGIMIWHDMFLHSNLYPDYDEAWVKEFTAEVEGVLREVRRHACLSLICGGNEQQEGWDEWGWKGTIERFFGERLFNQYIPPIAARLCPDIPYIPNSPHGGKWAQSPVEGECHNWGNFYNSTKDPLFVTETCWTSESYSRPETLKKYMGLDVDAPEWSTKGWPARWQERTHLGLFNRLPYSNWFTVETLRSYLYMLEIEQLRADYNALSMYRFRCPSNNGVIYWSHNKGGPLFQFGCVDYDGRPMMPYYAVQRVFAPLAVHAYRDVSDIVVMLSNHGAARVSGTVQALHIDSTGKVFGKWQWDVAAEAGVLLRVARLDGLYDRVIDRVNETFYVTVSVDGKPVSDDLLFFCPFSEYAGIHRPIKQSGLEAVVSGEKWRIRLDAETPVQLVELESNQKLLFSDDYFPLIPGYGKTIEVSLLEKTSDDPITLIIRPLSLDGTAKAEEVMLD